MSFSLLHWTCFHVHLAFFVFQHMAVAFQLQIRQAIVQVGFHSDSSSPGGSWAMDAGVVRQLDLRALLVTLFVIIAEILRRLRAPVQIDFSVNPVDLEQPRQAAPPRPRPGPALCNQFCRFCGNPCHRNKPDHSHHSCYQHRHLRD